MHLHFACVLACLSLHFALGGHQWEVINDVKPFEDSGTQEDILSQEDLIPYKPLKPKPKPKPKPRPAPRQPAAKHADNKKMADASLLKPNQAPRRGSSEVEEDDLLPLGVPRRFNQRHLLQLAPKPGPNLPPNVELQRLRLRSDAVNLSTACKDVVDEDCLFLVEQLAAHRQQQDEDFEILEPKEVSLMEASEEEDQSLLSRHKRQSNNNNKNNNNNGNNNNNKNNKNNNNNTSSTITDNDSDETSDNTDEGSGSSTSEETLYANESIHTNEGVFQTDDTIGVPYPGPASNFTKDEQDRYQNEFKKVLSQLFKAQLPGFVDVDISVPELINGTVVSNYAILLDMGQAAINLGQTNLEEKFFNQLNKSVIPELNSLLVFGTFIDPKYKTKPTRFIKKLKRKLDNYCGSLNPCENAGPEFDRGGCVNTGFASGVCPHKCTTIQCKNGAQCELNEKYKPYCNCGERFQGKSCEKRRSRKKKLTTGETVGVVISCVIVALCLGLCCSYLCCCRRRAHNVNYSYYEDECAQDQYSDSEDRWRGGLMVIPKPTALRYTPVHSLHEA